MKISKYVSYNEVIHSNTAKYHNIDNNPTEKQLKMIKICAIEIFDKVRVAANGPVKINSVFRSYKLNKKIGGYRGSQHLVKSNPTYNSYGAAFDIDDNYYHKGLSDMDNLAMGDFIRLNLDFDQLIYEGVKNGVVKWVHVSYRPDGKNRNEVLIMSKGDYYDYEGNKERFNLV